MARLYHLNGDPIAEYLGYSESNYLAMDPCFFVSAGADRRSYINVIDFRPKCGRGSKLKEANASNSENDRQNSPKPKPNPESEDVNRKPSTPERRIKRNASAALKKVAKTPKLQPAEKTNVLAYSSSLSTKPAFTSPEIPANSRNARVELPQESMPWGDAAIQALISHSSDYGGLSVSDILGLVLCFGLREIT
jgi:hypothetical protein